ncbi:UNVERIFIED_CONTAM: putative enoyl-CoA hydratase 1, peroxisomal [Sesamum calycinum]|uniref:Enoyl-CoA hydratase 1, peroxisomal n=1 Tax=Sesamum calycinum TaxID=2727403 RepID=A0AAW2R7Y8_9LAMI
MEIPLPPPEKLIFVHRQPNGVAYVIINRPKSLNSLTRSMMGDLAKAIKSLDSDNSVRVIILSGSGRAFCSGVDLTAAEDVFKGDVKNVETDPVAQMERCVGADLVFSICIREAQLFAYCSCMRNEKITWPSRAREVSLTAMAVTAEQAERWGLVNHVVEGSELLKKARQIAEAIIKNNEDLVLRKGLTSIMRG